MKIGLTYDLRSEYLARGLSETDVAECDSDETIVALETSIRANGHAPDRIGSAVSLCERLVRGDRWDLVFNIAEGIHGLFRESQVPCLLELYGVLYTFSDPYVCAVTLDKSAAKRIVLEAGLNTPAFQVVRSPKEAGTVSLKYPLFVKPIGEGTGKGIDARSKVVTPAQLAKECRRLIASFAQPVLVEEYLPGREFTVGIVGSGNAARALGSMEIEILDARDEGIYSYDTKEECEARVRYSTLRTGRLRRVVEELALKSYCGLGCRDAARVDIRLDREGQPSFLEVNPLPGLHPTHSDLPMIATRAGVTHAKLVRAIIESAVKRAKNGAR